MLPFTLKRRGLMVALMPVCEPWGVASRWSESWVWSRRWWGLRVLGMRPGLVLVPCWVLLADRLPLPLPLVSLEGVVVV